MPTANITTRTIANGTTQIDSGITNNRVRTKVRPGITGQVTKFYERRADPQKTPPGESQKLIFTLTAIDIQ
jgi:hypothetical protein